MSSQHLLYATFFVTIIVGRCPSTRPSEIGAVPGAITAMLLVGSAALRRCRSAHTGDVVATVCQDALPGHEAGLIRAEPHCDIADIVGVGYPL
jgi:hypothetical protein